MSGFTGGHSRVVAAIALAAAISLTAADQHFTFAILGDRTGEAKPGVYEQIWKEAAAAHPAFVITTGDTIEGQNDAAAEDEWRHVERAWKPYAAIPLYLTPGNHDIWSAASAQLFRKYSGHPLHYSFDYGQAHFVILDNSRSDELATEEIEFLKQDLAAHAGAPVKAIFTHRPSWILDVAARNRDFPLHRLAREYHVQYVIAGHIHQMLRLEFEGVTYLSIPSSGGHLRLSGAYRDGWFYGHARVEVTGNNMDIQIEEAAAPHGQGRITKLADWGMTGLNSQ